MIDLKEDFINWLIKQGLSEKTETGKPSTIYDCLTTINRVCKKEGYITWEKLAVNLFSIVSNYHGKYKTALHKYNAFLFETELSRRVIQQRYDNLLYAYSKLSDEEKKDIEAREYIITRELADILKVDILENKHKNKRKDINDKETHIHGIREVFDEDIDSKVRLALKTSVCNGKKEYKGSKYNNMLQTKKGYDKNGANGWLCYLNKGACSNNGLYISQSILEKIRDDYNQLYKEYKSDVKKLKDNGIKINYINL